jgi:hypothetical protein
MALLDVCYLQLLRQAVGTDRTRRVHGRDAELQRAAPTVGLGEHADYCNRHRPHQPRQQQQPPDSDMSMIRPLGRADPAAEGAWRCDQRVSPSGVAELTNPQASPTRRVLEHYRVWSELCCASRERNTDRLMSSIDRRWPHGRSRSPIVTSTTARVLLSVIRCCSFDEVCLAWFGRWARQYLDHLRPQLGSDLIAVGEPFVVPVLEQLSHQDELLASDREGVA